MRPADRLSWYAQYFSVVEVNSTFYSVPEPTLVRRWCDVTPQDFVFNIKLHQLLSHHSTPAKLLPRALQKKLRLEANAKVGLTTATMDEVLRAFAPSLEILRRAEKLGVLLLQLSPAFSPRKHKLNELENVLQLAGDFRVAVELRNRNWVEGKQREKTLDFLRERNAIFVDVDAPPEKLFTIMQSVLMSIIDSD